MELTNWYQLPTTSSSMMFKNKFNKSWLSFENTSILLLLKWFLFYKIVLFILLKKINQNWLGCKRSSTLSSKIVIFWFTDIYICTKCWTSTFSRYKKKGIEWVKVKPARNHITQKRERRNRKNLLCKSHQTGRLCFWFMIMARIHIF